MPTGFIGLGAMGRPMAGNLLRSGQPLIVWNRTLAASRELADLGAELASSPAEAARVDVLFTMLADDAVIREIVLEGGVLDALAPGSVHVNMATASVAFAQELASLHAQRGIGYVAAPVLGRVDVAAAGKLNILAAGSEQLLDQIQPLLDILGQKTWYFGEAPEQANAVKIAANFSIACAIEAMGESAALARSHGVPAASFLALLSQTLFAGSPVYQGYGTMIAEERYTPAGFKLPLGLKDIQLALDAGHAIRQPLPFASVLRDNLLEAIAQGDAELDWAALAKVSSRRGGLA